MVMNLLRSLNSWLQDQSGNEISYEALKKILDNTAQVSPDRVWPFLLISVPDFRVFCFFLSAFLLFKAAIRELGVEAVLVCGSSTHKPAKVNWARSRTVQGQLSLWPRRQVKITSGTPKLTEIRHYISDNTKGLTKINIFTFKTAVCEARGVCYWFGGRPRMPPVYHPLKLKHSLRYIISF